jgi:eukaryotic-like serine/threonine-protein kinase
VDTERWRKIEAIYHHALERNGSLRAAFVEEASGGDESLRRQVELLLSHSEGLEDFLESPALEVAARDLAKSAQDTQPHPATIGRYRIIRLLAEGGMGTVYEAEQDEPKRIVALKMIQLGLATPGRLRRFRQEGQILAGLAHPGIARLLDAGYTEAGAPFLVMEYVKGLPITQWCEERKLNLPARLRLFQKLCDAVQFAHQNLVVHRDLKPVNVLVTPDGEPKLLDFGIAKLTDPSVDATRTAEWALTLDYASPEQVRGGTVTTAADIYSLGILLYELIAGKRLNSFTGRPLEEAIDCICTRDPAPPSTVATGPLEDLDAIVLKALRKEPQERYSSAKALGDDIERYLTSQPVLARRGTFRYVATKFARRHWAAVAITVAVVLALCAAAGSVAWEARIAQRRFNDVQGLAGSMIFDLQDKLAALSGTTQVRKDLVAVAIRYLDALAKDGTGDPGLQHDLAAAYLRIGKIQGEPNEQNLGDLPAALESYAKAERLARALVAGRPSGQAKRLLGDVLTAQASGAKFANQSAKGLALAKEALQLARERARSEPASKDAQFQLGAALNYIAFFGTTKDELPYLVEEAAVFEGMLAHDPDNPKNQRNAALPHKYIASALIILGDLDGSFPHLKRAEELDEACVRAQPTPEHKMDLAIDLGQWGEYYEGKNDFVKAIQYIQTTLAIRRELASADPRDERAQVRLSYILNRMGNLQLHLSARQALESYREAESIAQRFQTESLRARELAAALSGIGEAYRKLGDEHQACPAFAESMKLYREIAKNTSRYAEQIADNDKAYSRCSDASP